MSLCPFLKDTSKTLVRHNGEKLAPRIANRSSLHRGWKNCADLPRRKGGERAPQGESASLARAKKRRDQLASHLRSVLAAAPDPPADTDRLPPQGNYGRRPEPVPLEKVSDKKPRLNANARRPGP